MTQDFASDGGPRRLPKARVGRWLAPLRRSMSCLQTHDISPPLPDSHWAGILPIGVWQVRPPDGPFDRQSFDSAYAQLILSCGWSPQGFSGDSVNVVSVRPMDVIGDVGTSQRS